MSNPELDIARLRWMKAAPAGPCERNIERPARLHRTQQLSLQQQFFPPYVNTFKPRGITQ